MKVTLGGDRLGSGNKNKIALHNYERSTHNLSQRWTSSMAPGVLYPFLVLPAMRGDKFEIDLEAAARTIPTQGPLFGSYKMQIDIFKCPVRLYQAILHNNPINIGLKMSQVKLPQIIMTSNTYKDEITKGVKLSNSCLLKYLGVSGLGHSASQATDSYITRNFNAVPLLAYYDIFKNYYSNKQEENAYVIGRNFQAVEIEPETYWYNLPIGDVKVEFPISQQFILNDTTPYNPIFIKLNGKTTKSKFEDNMVLKIYNTDAEEHAEYTLLELGENVYFDYDSEDGGQTWKLTFVNSELRQYIMNDNSWSSGACICKFAKNDLVTNWYGLDEAESLQLVPFPLKNIDMMREKILSYHTLGTPFFISGGVSSYSNYWDRNDGETDSQGLPYTINCDRKGASHDGDTLSTDPLNGLVVKTYQSDLFNNWINTDWIDGENGIAAITAISTASGDKFTIDSLNLAEKLYNMLNRIAVSGGTYQDWQDAVYTESPIRHLESPVYLGGMSNEVVFEEIVQTAPAPEAGEDSVLGNLGGRGTLIKRKGGNVTVKCDEACFIIGIVSLTPRIMYTQGNEFYMTDLKSVDDFHKPALDGIGFQDLIAERAAWWDTTIAPETSTVLTRHKLGKVPAWIEYMTAVDKAYGDFAEEGGKGFMVLNRNYEVGTYGVIKDATTYVDPVKYNYAFAYNEIDAQNFWVQIQSNIRARRLMSAKQIPNI